MGKVLSGINAALKLKVYEYRTKYHRDRVLGSSSPGATLANFSMRPSLNESTSRKYVWHPRLSGILILNSAIIANRVAVLNSEVLKVVSQTSNLLSMHIERAGAGLRNLLHFWRKASKLTS